jgi:hypothetical protein
VVGAANVTLAGLVAAVSVTSAGQLIVNAGTDTGGGVGGGVVTGGVDGAVGEEHDEASVNASAPRVASAAVERRGCGVGSLAGIGSNLQYYYRINQDKTAAAARLVTRKPCRWRGQRVANS